MAIRVLRPREAQAKLSVGNSHFYELLRTDPSFPRPVILDETPEVISKASLTRGSSRSASPLSSESINATKVTAAMQNHRQPGRTHPLVRDAIRM